MSICVAAGNKVMDTRLPQPVGCGDKYDVLGWYWRCKVSSFCTFFKYPSPDTKASPSPARGEVAGLLRCVRNGAERTNIVLKGLDVVCQYAALLERRVQTGTRARKALVVTRQANPLGRSMIEMLGVLAIIGVLSVGGIAGYGKAMRMWRANVQKQMIESLLHSMIEIRDKFHEKNNEIEVTPILAAMGYTPEGATFNGRYFVDKNGNKMHVLYGLAKYYNADGSLKDTDYLYALHFYAYTDASTILDPSLQDYCISLVEAAKSLGKEYISTGSSLKGQNGKMYLLFNYTTLQKATLSDVYKKCKIAFEDKQTGFSHFTTHIKPY